MVANRRKRILVCDSEALAEDDGGDGAVEQDRACLVRLARWHADFAGELQLLRWRMRPKEVVTPGRERASLRIHIPKGGQRGGLGDNPFDVTNEGGRTRLKFGANRFYLQRDRSRH